MKKIELLAPAKNLEAARAAIDFGADAVYIGASRFGARAAATNSVEDLAKAAEYAHLYGAKLYATLNTVIYDNELRAAEQQAREIIDAGADALIIQDMAYARMGLNIDLHASTQVCNATSEDLLFLQNCGFTRAVLERNLSLDEIREISAVANKIELEAFVHGAICVGLSGRCYLSRSQSSRSGNRGECSQPCRLSYDLMGSSGERIVEGKHLLSVRDLSLGEHLRELLDAGVCSFKIEGRLKELSYTKNVVAYYRSALDRALAEYKEGERSSVGTSHVDFQPQASKSFTRGETIYMLHGQQPERASLESPKAMGESLGKVSKIAERGFFIQSDKPLATGDGLCFLSADGLMGSSINFVERRGAVWYVETNSKMPVKRTTEIFRNFDRLFENKIAASRTRRTIEVAAKIESCEDKIKITYTDCEGLIASAEAVGQFELAKQRDKMLAVITEQLSKTGDSIFELKSLNTDAWQGEFVAASLLSSLRREALSALQGLRLKAAEEKRHAPFEERREARYKSTILGCEVPVCNALAREFYSDHGVEEFAQSLECRDSHEGEVVMESAYCIRHEIGECLKKGSRLGGRLSLKRGDVEYDLEFDCARCRMRLIKR